MAKGKGDGGGKSSEREVPGAEQLRRVFWRQHKKQGEWSELRFMAAAFDRGFNVMRPWGDSCAYDVFLEQDGRVLRVQVKSAGSWCYRRKKGEAVFTFGTARNSGSMRYAPTDLDFYALYVIPLDLWYIVPAGVIGRRKSVFVCPSGEGTHPRGYHYYAEYKEAWELLGKNIRKERPGLTLHACVEGREEVGLGSSL